MPVIAQFPQRRPPASVNSSALRFFKFPMTRRAIPRGGPLAFYNWRNFMSTTLLREAIRRGLRSYGVAGASVALGCIAAPAVAQDAAGANDQKGQALDTIVVTGSNIRRVDIETANPVITIDRAAILQSGKLTLGDLVQDLPAVTGGNTNPQVNNGGGAGSASIGLRGLGGARTLVLIDGHRIVNGDPNSIPANMIERIEVLTDGASSVYGSDAIAGVVNFILRSNYQGAEFSTDYGISDHDDGQRNGYHFVFGQTTDKGSIIAGVDYNKTREILAGNRNFSKNAVSITGSAQTPPYGFVGGSSFPAYGRIQLPASLASTFGCNYVALNKGASGRTVDTSNYHCFVNNGASSDKYNYATVNLDDTPQERASAFIKGTYHLTDNIDAYLDYYHNKTSANFQLAPALFGTTSGAVIDANAYYNPFGASFNGTDGLDYRERLVSLGDRQALSGVNTDQLNTGFKGNFNMFTQDWTWDASFGYGHTAVVTTTLNLPNQNILNADLGPSHLDPTTGTVVCDSGVSGCVPFNPFNLFDPNSIAALKAAAVPAISNAYAIEKYENLDFAGGLFNLPAGTVQLAAGASHRSEYIDAQVDPLLTIDPTTGNCVLGSQCASPLQGGYTVKEIYAESLIPLIKDVPFINALNLTLGERYSRYSNFGGTNNWKAALEYRPIEDLLLRGTVSSVFRAPTVGNIFGAPVSSAPLLSSDPCDYAGTGANPNAGNPACKNVPATGPFTDQNVLLHQQIHAIASGSEYAGFPLGPETGKSFDYGFVYDPHWVPGLSFNSDIYRIYLNNTITPIGAQNVINACFAGQLIYCPLITRTASGPNQGQIANLLEPTGNLGRTDTQGVDIGVKYRLPQLSFGQFSVALNATYTGQYNQQTDPGKADNVVFHDAGHLAPFSSPEAGACPGAVGVCLFPRWRAQSFINWQLGAWDASLTTRYIDQGVSAIPGLPNYVLHYGATVYNNVQLGYNIEALNTRLDIGVDNVTNKQPPFLYANNTLNANTDPSDFDTVGRFYFARVTVKF
jgi:outer membrane receptor protein involved in Fe transport